MSVFKAHWNAGPNTDGHTQYAYRVAPLCIGGIVVEREFTNPDNGETGPVYAYLGGDWRTERPTKSVAEAKDWIEWAWLGVLAENAPGYLPGPTEDEHD